MTQRLVIRSINVRSAARSGFGVSLALWAIGFVGFVALYLLGLVSGGLGGVEGFIASLGFTGFRLSILPFLLAFVVVAGLASALVAIFVGLLAHLYNGLVPILGGVEAVVGERTTRPRPVVRDATPQPAPPPPQPQVFQPPPPPPVPQPFPRDPGSNAP